MRICHEWFGSVSNSLTWWVSMHGFKKYFKGQPLKYKYTGPKSYFYHLYCLTVKGNSSQTELFMSVSICSEICGGYGSASADGSSCSRSVWTKAPRTSCAVRTVGWRWSACSNSTLTRWFTSASPRTTCTGTRRSLGHTRWPNTLINWLWQRGYQSTRIFHFWTPQTPLCYTHPTTTLMKMCLWYQL